MNSIVSHCVEQPYKEFKKNGKWHTWDPPIKEMVKENGLWVLNHDTTAQRLWELYDRKAHWATKITWYEKKYKEILKRKKMDWYLRELRDTMLDNEITPPTLRKRKPLVDDNLKAGVEMGVPTPPGYYDVLGRE